MAERKLKMFWIIGISVLTVFAVLVIVFLLKARNNPIGDTNERFHVESQPAGAEEQTEETEEEDCRCSAPNGACCHK